VPTVNEGGDVEEQDREEDENNPPTATLTGGASPCVAGEFKSALDTLFEIIEGTQSWYVLCVNHNYHFDAALQLDASSASAINSTYCIISSLFFSCQLFNEGQ
jgi:hypothetical protein